jgi:hypothetical protein
MLYICKDQGFITWGRFAIPKRRNGRNLNSEFSSSSLNWKKRKRIKLVMLDTKPLKDKKSEKANSKIPMIPVVIK